MPAHDGLGLDQNERIAPSRPEPAQRAPKHAIKVIETRPRMFAFEHGNLLAQGEYLQTEVMTCAKKRE